MSFQSNQTGFSVIETSIIVAVIAVLGFVGYNVYSRQQAKTSDNTGTAQTASQDNESPKATDVSSAPAINSTSDLDKAAATLDQNDPATANDTDASQLNSQANNF